MSGNHNPTLRFMFQRGTDQVKALCEGVSNEDSLRKMPLDHNCINYTIGHMIQSRNSILKTLGVEDFDWSESMMDSYGANIGTTEDALAGAGKGLTLEQLLAKLDESQILIDDALAGQDIEDFSGTREFFDNPEATAKDVVGFMSWHESQHLGQLDVLVQVLKLA